MHRRNIVTAMLAGIGGLAAAAGSRANADIAKPDKSKVAYHLSDANKVEFVLGNIQNHYDGVGGPDKVTIALVVHGPALKAFHALAATPDVSERVQKFSKLGTKLNACGNTMKAQKVTLKDLLPGFVEASQGGVVKLAELQGEGYVYLRP
jgi:intracellular sulfur oxidation DsrE/DsrF family protein